MQIVVYNAIIIFNKQILENKDLDLNDEKEKDEKTQNSSSEENQNEEYNLYYSKENQEKTSNKNKKLRAARNKARMKIFAGKAIKTAGKTIKITAKLTKTLAKGIKKMGDFLKKQGKNLIRLGKSLCKVGYGAGSILGLPLIAAGSAAYISGATMSLAGKLTAKSLEGLENLGNSIEQKGDRIINQGRAELSAAKSSQANQISNTDIPNTNNHELSASLILPAHSNTGNPIENPSAGNANAPEKPSNQKKSKDNRVLRALLLSGRISKKPKHPNRNPQRQRAPINRGPINNIGRRSR